MNTIKNIFVGLLVLAISSGIFSWLFWEQEGKTNVLASTFKDLGNNLLDVIHDPEQRNALAKLWDDFIGKIEKNQVSEADMNTTFARAVNLELSTESSDEKPNPEEIQAFFESAIKPNHPQNVDSVAFEHQLSEMEQERLALRMRQLMEIKDEILNFNDKSISREFSRHTMVMADSDLQFIIDANIHHNPVFAADPNAKQFIENLPKKKWVKVEKFQDSPEFVTKAIEFYAPMIPENLRMPIILNAISAANISLVADSLKFEFQTKVFSLDSLETVIENVMKNIEAINETK